MKNKKILLSVIGIFIITTIIVVIVKNNTKEYINYDGAMLALTVDGEKATSFPSDISKYHVDITCDGGIGEYLPDDNYEMKFTIKDITKDGVKCNIDFTTITDSNKSEYLLRTKVEQVNTTNNNGYRYSGKQPDNWVWFNNELWRIIGSIPTILSDNTTDNRVKIIRTDSIGSLVYATTNSTYAAWGDSPLYRLLNNYYYGKLDATGVSPCFRYNDEYYAICDYTTKGISSESNDYYGRMILDVYMNVRYIDKTTLTINSLYLTEAETLTSNPVKIGLMLLSDYGYAISEISYSTVTMSDLSSYEQNNWLYSQGIEWTMTRYRTSSSSYGIVGLSEKGGFLTGDPDDGRAVRPVVYLDPDVYIISGNGTESNPYILGLS